MNLKYAVLTMALILALGSATPGQAFQDSPEAVVVDALVARPACFVATVLGASFFVVTLPIAAISKSTRKTARVLVVKPAEATFTRPLGDFGELAQY